MLHSLEEENGTFLIRKNELSEVNGRCKNYSLDFPQGVKHKP